MALDMGRIRERQAQTEKGAGDRFKFKEGPNRIRIFKFSHMVTKADIKAGHFVAEKLGKEVEEIDRPCVIHFNVGKDNRPVESYPEIMAEYKKLSVSRAEADQKRAKDIGPQTRYAVNLVDTAEAPPVMRHVMLPKTVYNAILASVADEDYGEAILGCEGRDFTVVYDKNAQGSDKYKVSVRDEAKCKPISEDVLTDLKDLYSPEGYAALGILPPPGAAAPAAEAEAEEPEEEVPAAKPAKAAAKPAKPAPAAEEEDEDIAAPPAKPGKKPVKPAPAAEEEDDD